MPNIQSVAPVTGPASVPALRSGAYRPAGGAVDDPAIAAAAAKSTAAPAPSTPDERTSAAGVAPVSDPGSGSGVPPEGYLPSTQQVLSQLTPADRAAIAGVTGYYLSPSGQIINPGGMPPWSFIIGYAEHRRADRAGEAQSDAAAATAAAEAARRSAPTAQVDIVV